MCIAPVVSLGCTCSAASADCLKFSLSRWIPVSIGRGWKIEMLESIENLADSTKINILEDGKKMYLHKIF